MKTKEIITTAGIEKKFESTTEIRRCDTDDGKFQLRSDGNIYEYSLGWNRTPLREWHKKCVKVRIKHNIPVDLGLFSEIDILKIESARKIIEERENLEKFRIKKINDDYNQILTIQPIPTTIHNLLIIMLKLSLNNWGVWELPKMTIPYRALSFDCGGVTAVAVTLDKKISDSDRDIKNKYKFSILNPNGYLGEYTKLRG